MVTKPQHQSIFIPLPQPAVPLPDDYLCPDPEPRDMIQSPTINKAGYFVGRHFAPEPETMVRAPIVVNYDPFDMNERVEPDLLVAFGVDLEPIMRRNGYIIWEVGKPPEFVMEVASESTHHRDTGFKRDRYASIGVTEYWRVDPTGGDHYGYALAGDRLADGAYQELPITTEPDGMVWGYSPTLDLCLCWYTAWDWDVDDASNLRFYNRKTGRYLCDQALVEAKLAAAEERIRQLEAQLGQQQS